MIERWFPGPEVSANSSVGWGSGNQEIALFPWFAKRPTAQAKAAILCSLLPWPEDASEQERLQQLVREAMAGRYAAWDAIRAELRDTDIDGGVLDPFSGRGMIPLEAARLGVRGHAVDYSPVAVLASTILTDYPFRSWDSEPELPFQASSNQLYESRARLLRDVEGFFNEVDRRWTTRMSGVYPPGATGQLPWGYLWAITLPCQDCGTRFPLVGSYELRPPSVRRGQRDEGQSFYIDVDASKRSFHVVVHSGPAQRTPAQTGRSVITLRQVRHGLRNERPAVGPDARYCKVGLGALHERHDVVVVNRGAP